MRTADAARRIVWDGNYLNGDYGTGRIIDANPARALRSRSCGAWVPAIRNPATARWVFDPAAKDIGMRA